MKKFSIIVTVGVLFLFLFQNCEDDYDDVLHYRSVNEFVWKGLNQYYFWQAEVDDLADNRFANKSVFDNFLNQYASPVDLFNYLKKEEEIDRFSVIFNDYEVLEGILQGNTKNNGADFELRYKPGSTTELFGWVRYILPNSDAATKNIQRGNVFYAVDGVALTTSNFRSLLASETYTLNFANYNNGNIVPNGQSVSLTKTDYEENPVLIQKVFEEGNKKIGYLMYNGFYSNFAAELNNAFAYFQSQGVTHLILDLRYNSGGSVNVATELASMITGQFNGQVFAKQLWNSKITNFYSSNPDALLNRFKSNLSSGAAINSLQLSKLYVITSKATASASELIINSLKSYIEVVKIGETTTGKNVGSITLYDSPTFTKSNVNPNHKYAMQPIVLKIANKNNESNYENGIIPNFQYIENIGNLGELGSVSDPLLNTALNFVILNGRGINTTQNQSEATFFKDTKTITSVERGMFVELQ